jgi:hypothetical protein
VPATAAPPMAPPPEPRSGPEPPIAADLCGAFATTYMTEGVWDATSIAKVCVLLFVSVCLSLCVCMYVCMYVCVCGVAAEEV